MKIKLRWYPCQYLPTLNQWGRLQIAHLALDLNFYQSLCKASIEVVLNLEKKGTTRQCLLVHRSQNERQITISALKAVWRPEIKVDNLLFLHPTNVFIQRICSKQTSIKNEGPMYKLCNSNTEDATHTFNNLLPQWQSSISINACNCITIFWRNPNNFHNARFMNLEEYQWPNIS